MTLKTTVEALKIPINTPTELLTQLEPRIPADDWRRARAWVKNALLYERDEVQGKLLDLCAIESRGHYEATVCFADGVLFSVRLYTHEPEDRFYAYGVAHSKECCFQFSKGRRWEEQLKLLGIESDVVPSALFHGGRDYYPVAAKSLPGGQAWVLIEASLG